MIEHMFETPQWRLIRQELQKGGYPDDMAVHASDVAAALRYRIPGLPSKKMHKLLYYCQGHHLASLGHPLFSESIMAWDMGPVVALLWKSEHEGRAVHTDRPLDEAQLNTVGYVVSRYGQLSGRDLEHLTHSEEPWQRANVQRRPGKSVRIEQEWLRDYFALDQDEDPDVVLRTDVVADWLADARERRAVPAMPDDVEEIRARLAHRA
jgi:uncharacterized phage-associated protein